MLWAVLFASQLVLLVVLLGRERMRRFPFFTAGILFSVLRLLCEVLLSGRMAIYPLQRILISMQDVASVLSLLVVIEIARRALPGASRKAWLLAAPVLSLAAAAALIPPWPSCV
jgi:chromate transport protein ChrA